MSKYSIETDEQTGKFYVRTPDYLFDHNSREEAEKQVALFERSDERSKHPIVRTIVPAPKLVSVVAERTNNKKRDIKYVGTLEDGSKKLIRTSPREYAGVAQIAGVKETQLDRTYAYGESFKFSGKGSPSLAPYEVYRHVTTVQVEFKR